MIVSVSRRTDIPAFYSDWFIDKIEQGFLYVVNPFNRKQISNIICKTINHMIYAHPCLLGSYKMMKLLLCVKCLV